MKATTTPIIVIRPLRGWIPINFREVWAYRQLLYFFAWRDIKVRYKQTVLGAAWAILRPVMLMVVFTLVFGNLMNVPSLGIPYPLFSYAALLPWTMFAEGVVRASDSLVADRNIVQKIYFPRLVMPMSGILSPLVDFAIAFVIFIAMMFYFDFPFTIRILWLPVFLLLALVTTLSIGLWFSAINAQYRDVRYALPFVVQLWLFASPVIYSSTLLPERFQIIYGLNPMAGVIEGFRWALLGTEPPGSLIIVSAIIVVLALISGAYYFRRMERVFADVV